MYSWHRRATHSADLPVNLLWNAAPADTLAYGSKEGGTIRTRRVLHNASQRRDVGRFSYCSLLGRGLSTGKSHSKAQADDHEQGSKLKAADATCVHVRIHPAQSVLPACDDNCGVYGSVASMCSG